MGRHVNDLVDAVTGSDEEDEGVELPKKRDLEALPWKIHVCASEPPPSLALSSRRTEAPLHPPMMSPPRFCGIEEWVWLILSLLIDWLEWCWETQSVGVTKIMTSVNHDSFYKNHLWTDVSNKSVFEKVITIYQNVTAFFITSVLYNHLQSCVMKYNFCSSDLSANNKTLCL